MNTCNDSNKPSVKQSFKAVENFLRRIAYNLGNSPSRTDVKIVSCIPIDVTDLQQRIIQLQNELEECKAANNEAEKPTTDVYTTCTNHNINKHLYCNECLLTTTSVLSVSCPTVCPSLEPKFSSVVSPSFIPNQDTAAAKTEELIKHKQFLSKKKKECKPKYPKTHLVYRAHADTKSPFRNDASFAKYYDTKQETDAGALSRSYLTEVIQRQYRPNDRPLLIESNVSDISYPVCRDEPPLFSQGAPYSESDSCSCCHGQYQNVDKYMNNKFNIYSPYENVENARKYHKSSYYDSNFYDIVPVKEKVAKKNNTVLQKGKASKKPTIKCWPGKERPKTTVVNFCALPPVAEIKNGRSPTRSRINGDVVPSHMASKRVETSTPRRPRERDDYSHDYTKQDRKNIKHISVPVTTQVQDAATDSIVSDMMPICQTATTITDKDPPEDKTEITLNEIKDILQSVLTEVKTNSMLTNLPAQPKKDAIIQNGPLTASQACEYGASQLLHTYTYSPHNIINPYNLNMNPYKAACSHTMPSNNFMYSSEYPGVPGIPGVPAVPIQQYPLLIQPQKLMCSSYYRNNNISKPVTKYAATVTTNTDQPQEHSKETERLIKEIYKSIALNIEESSKDNSVLEYMKTKSITDKYINAAKVESDTETERISKAISEIFKNSHLPDSTVTATTASTYTGYKESNKFSTEYKEPVKKEYKRRRVYSHREPDNYVNRIEQKSYYRPHHYTIDRSDTTVINEVTEEEVSSDAETITDIAVVQKETLKARETKKPTETPKVMETKKAKSGVLKKMFKSFFQPKTSRYRREGGKAEKQKESESDSDDYQTVYSQKVTTSKPKKVTAVRSRPHSKVFNTKKPQQRPRTKSPEKQRTRSPSYTEQEYRRYLEEKRESYERQRKKYSADVGRGTCDDNQKVQAYYQQYEARPVLVDPVRQPPLRPPGFGVRMRYSPNKAKHTRRTDCSPSTAPANQYKPHYVASKSKRKGFFSRDWLKKTKIQCGKCKNEWKELIVNG